MTNPVHDAVPTSGLQRLAGYLGVMPRYIDQTFRWHETTDPTMAAIVAAMGYPVADGDRALGDIADSLRTADERRAMPQWLVVEADKPGPPVASDWRLQLETGEWHEGRGVLPTLPLGIHALYIDDDCTWLLCAPATLPTPPRSWGLTVPLYGLRTSEQGGIGSYADLAELAGGLGDLGAGFVGINPIHAGFSRDVHAFSPYSPSSRRRFSTLHIAAGSQPDDHATLIDYDAVLSAQGRALSAAFSAFAGHTDFDAFLAREGEDLRLFALHQALSDSYGAYWPHWPMALQKPGSPEVAAFAQDNASAVRYHAWLQWLAEQQLGDVRNAADDMALGLYLDLAVGTHPEGAETWADPALFATGCSLGAPPDGFSADGQRWNLAPLHPRALAAAGFAPLAKILRAQLRFARVLRIDHILGFDRAFWVPQETGVPGAYVAMPKTALLAVARIEAARVGAVIIGEDLGNIPEGLYDDLDASGILGCRVAMFEQDNDSVAPSFKGAESYDRAALTSFSSHDLPTCRGWQTGCDIDWRLRLGTISETVAADATARRAREVAAFASAIGGTGNTEVTRFLARTPSHLVAVQAEDVLKLEQQPNLPGTVYDHPNWRRRLGVSIGELLAHPAMVETGRIMKADGR